MTCFEWVQTITSGVTAAFTMGTFGVLIKYTIETMELRKAAQKQNENVLLPILFIGQSKYEAASTYALPERMIIRNVGSGPAFNASTEPMPCGIFNVQFIHPGTIAAGEEHNLRVLFTYQDGRPVKDSSTVLSFWPDLNSGSPDFTGRTTISYRAANNSSHSITVIFKAQGTQILLEKRESAHA
jgi:hypothetical protein